MAGVSTPQLAFLALISTCSGHIWVSSSQLPQNVFAAKSVKADCLSLSWLHCFVKLQPV